jgi:gamma-glutamyltranspeptidase/glutathione hydrolase
MSAPHRHAYRPAVLGTRGVVASAHPLASAAGIEMLVAGGNAIDAAVAVGAALAVVEPYMSGVGGIGLALVLLRGEPAPRVLDFVGPVPVAADPDRADAADLVGGPRSCVTPGCAAGWLALLEAHGTMPAPRVFAPAVRLAERGVPLTFKNVEFFGLSRATLERSAEAGRLYAGATEPRVGAVLRQPELGSSLRRLAEEGPGVLYGGAIGQAICEAVERAGGWLSMADLAGYRPQWRAPIQTSYRGFDVFTVPPPFAAFQHLLTLNLLEGFDLRAWGHNGVLTLHHIVEAIKVASADRVAYVARDDAPIAGLLSKAYARARRALIDPKGARPSEGERFHPERLPGQILPGHPADFAKEQTTHFACADADGNVVTVTQTLGSPFGSGFAAPGTGIVLNNIASWLDLDPASPNRLRPGRQPGVNMSPTQVLRAGAFHLSIGTPGSFGILQTTPQMVVNVLDFGMNVQETIEAPRVRVYRDRLVDVEGRVDASVREGLAALGHDVRVLEDWSWVVGGGQGIARDPESGALSGGADPRRDGYAIAL